MGDRCCCSSYIFIRFPASPSCNPPVLIFLYTVQSRSAPGTASCSYRCIHGCSQLLWPASSSRSHAVHIPYQLRSDPCGNRTDPGYWTDPPAGAYQRRLHHRKCLLRAFSLLRVPDRPGHASRPCS